MEETAENLGYISEAATQSYPEMFHGAFGEIRAVRDKNGEPLFVAKDVCAALDIDTTNVPAKMAHVPDEWKGRHPIATPGGHEEASK